MATNGVTTQSPAPAQYTSPTPASHRRRFYVSGLVVRMLIALVISWLIVMAFFISGAISH